jgi:predicted ATP-dependent protease
MLIPVENCKDVPKDYSGKMVIVPVESINGAISALNMRWENNVPTCTSPQIWHDPSKDHS